MTGKAIERQAAQPPATREEPSREALTPTVIDARGTPIADRDPSRAATLVKRGLDLASSVLRLVQWWMENEKPTTRPPQSAQPASTPRRSPRPGTGGADRGGDRGAHRRRRRRGRSA